jgi:hypothetical protein
MSKELIEQLAKEAGFHVENGEIKNYPHQYYSVTNSDIATKLEAFAKAYQAAAPIDNVAVPVAEIRWIKHLEGKASEFHEYGASEGKRLPVGTKFFTATPQVKQMLENAAKIADEYSGDGINPACAEVAERIRALIPDTQAAPIENGVKG